MGIPVKLKAFEGPLDLLLHLIDKNKVNIYDIPIIEITSQYLEYIQDMGCGYPICPGNMDNNMKSRDMNIMSEFLVMAATLLDIKSRMLLPQEVNEEGIEEDPRQELVEKLLEYKLYKYMSCELRDKQGDAEQILYKLPTIPSEVQEYRPKASIEELLGDLTLSKMHAIFKSVMKRQVDRIDPIRSSFGTLEKEEVDMDATWERVVQYIREKKSCGFRKLLGEQRTKMKIIVTFLVILELMKVGTVSIIQGGNFEEIYLSVIQEEE